MGAQYQSPVRAIEVGGRSEWRRVNNGHSPNGTADLAGYEPTSSPIWLEALFPLDWIALHASPVYYGFGVPHGHAEPVVLVPGFLGDDRYLTEMHMWLRRIGYRPRVLKRASRRHHDERLSAARGVA